MCSPPVPIRPIESTAVPAGCCTRGATVSSRMPTASVVVRAGIEGDGNRRDRGGASLGGNMFQSRRQYGQDGKDPVVHLIREAHSSIPLDPPASSAFQFTRAYKWRARTPVAGTDMAPGVPESRGSGPAYRAAGDGAVRPTSSSVLFSGAALQPRRPSFGPAGQAMASAAPVQGKGNRQALCVSQGVFCSLV